MDLQPSPLECSVDTLYFPLEKVAQCFGVVNILRLSNCSRISSLKYKVRSTHSAQRGVQRGIVAAPSQGVLVPLGTTEVEVRWDPTDVPVSENDFSTLHPPKPPHVEVWAQEVDGDPRMPQSPVTPRLRPISLSVSFAWPPDDGRPTPRRRPPAGITPRGRWCFFVDDGHGGSPLCYSSGPQRLEPRDELDECPSVVVLQREEEERRRAGGFHRRDPAPIPDDGFDAAVAAASAPQRRARGVAGAAGAGSGSARTATASPCRSARRSAAR